MKEFRTTTASPVGLHARPAALFASSAKASGCTVRLAKVLPNGEFSAEIDGASVLRVMTLGVKFGDEIIVKVEGPDEEGAAAALQAIVESSDH